MTTELDDLHRVALIVATKLIAQLNDEQQQRLDLAVRGGAKIALEITLPDAETVQLSWIEPEGHREKICSITTTPAVMQ